jgi:alginate O-acetyltransferase complex protein AlgI
LAFYGFSIQIYCDFSGYSNIAIGVAKILGYELPDNFNRPYFSQSVREFWRRWHITLGSFMRDYLYIPLGGNRVDSKYRIYFNLWIVFLLSGLWHGASWNYVIWGAYHGLFLILDRLFLLKVLKRIGKIPSILFTFLFVMIGWVIFRLESIHAIKIYLVKLFSFNSFEFDAIPAFGFIATLSVVFSTLVLFKQGRKLENFVFYTDQYSLKNHFIFTVISLLLILLSIISITSSDFNPFIYFRF